MASKKRGVSAEEKRRRMQEFFFETRDVYQLKELEKLLPKAKGIVAQSVKDVLQELVNDNLVHCEKVGTSNYFWAFPSEGLRGREGQLDNLEKERTRLMERQAAVEEEIAQARRNRIDTDSRTELLEALRVEEAKKQALLTELQQFQDSDPEIIESKRQMAELAKQAANRWTDNIFALQSYCATKFNIDTAALRKGFNIPEDLDHIA